MTSGFLITEGELADPGSWIAFIDSEVDRRVNQGLEITARNMASDFSPLVDQALEHMEVWQFEPRNIQAWGIRCQPGTWANWHDHAHTNFIGLFYLTDGAPLVLETVAKTEHPIYPAPGRIVTHPGEMRHRVAVQPGFKNRYAVGMAFT